jgi:hypothetical protein
MWYRNTWAWQREDPDPGGTSGSDEPVLRQVAPGLIEARHRTLGDYWLACQGAPDLLFTENETNAARLWDGVNASTYVKDGINDAVVNNRTDTVNPAQVGTKAAAHYAFTVAPGATETVVLRLSDGRVAEPFDDAEQVLALRQESGAGAASMADVAALEGVAR